MQYIPYSLLQIYKPSSEIRSIDHNIFHLFSSIENNLGLEIGVHCPCQSINDDVTNNEDEVLEVKFKGNQTTFRRGVG